MGESARRPALAVDAATDRGLVRSINEDSIFTGEAVFVVADGMGGHDKGDAASGTAVGVFRDRLGTLAALTPAHVLDAIDRANLAVRALSAEGDTGSRVAGTTLTGLALVNVLGSDKPYWMAFNVGDSRVYSWDGRSLRQVTVDHSAVQELIDGGLITEAEAARHPDRNVITRALGAEDDVDADIWLLPVAGAQTFLLCSDGLCKELHDDEIEDELVRVGTGPGTASLLVQRAIERGGRDNVSVIVLASSMATDADGLGATVDRLVSADEDTTPRRGEH